MRDLHVLQRVAELTLVFALFGTGLRITRITRARRVTLGLLLVGAMTLTVAAVAAFAAAFMGFSPGAAIILAPTDPSSRAASEPGLRSRRSRARSWTARCC